MSLRAAVIGGGISGLASAHRIADLGHEVSLFESEDYLGGLGSTFRYGDRDLERFYHCMLRDDDALLALVRDLGLDRQMCWANTLMGFMYRGRTYPLNTPMDLLRFSPLTIRERIRMGRMGLVARKRGMDPKLDAITAQDWIRGMVGDRAFEILWKPLLSAKIGDRYTDLPALWLSSRMKREKSSKTEVKGYLEGGYRSLIDAFARRIEERGGHIHMRTRVEGIERDGDGMALTLEDGTRQTFDFVVATSSLPHFQRMTGSLGLDPAIADMELDYQGVVSGMFLTRKPMSRYYWTPWVDSGVGAQGAIEMSNLIPHGRTEWLHVSYLVNYTHRDSDLFRKSDDELLDAYERDMATLYPDVAEGIADRFLFRAPYVEPIWSVGYDEVRPPTTILPGLLYLACTALVYPRVNSWNSCCNVVEEMMPALTRETAERHGVERS